MEHVLVKYSSNWADEMDIDGFRMMTKDEYLAWVSDWTAYFKQLDGDEYSYCIGTNEDIPYDDVEGFFNDFEEKYITEDQYNTFVLYFGKEYGFFPVKYDCDKMD